MIQNLSWWLFIAIAPVAYWVLPARMRPSLLALGSLAVLVPGAPLDMGLMLAVSLLIFGSCLSSK